MWMTMMWMTTQIECSCNKKLGLKKSNVHKTKLLHHEQKTHTVQYALHVCVSLSFPNGWYPQHTQHPYEHNINKHRNMYTKTKKQNIQSIALFIQKHKIIFNNNIIYTYHIV
eukprot:PhM_4_TR8318/c3_g1_i1/m.77646